MDEVNDDRIADDDAVSDDDVCTALVDALPHGMIRHIDFFMGAVVDAVFFIMAFACSRTAGALVCTSAFRLLEALTLDVAYELS